MSAAWRVDGLRLGDSQDISRSGHGCSPEALRELESWVRSGQIRYRDDILDGIEQAPGSIAGLYRGENLGKRLIRIAPDARMPYLETPSLHKPRLDTGDPVIRAALAPWPALEAQGTVRQSRTLAQPEERTSDPTCPADTGDLCDPQ